MNSHLCEPLLRLVEEKIRAAHGGALSGRVVPHVVGRTADVLHGGGDGRADVDVHVPGALHAHVLVVVLNGEARAVERVRPREPEALQHGVAPHPHVLAEAPARPDGVGHLLRAHRDVHRAQEQLQLRAAAVLDQRREGGEVVLGLLLELVAAEVGHPRHVVPQPPAHLHLDGLARAQRRLGDAQPHRGEDEEGAREHVRRRIVVGRGAETSARSDRMNLVDTEEPCSVARDGMLRPIGTGSRRTAASIQISPGRPRRRMGGRPTGMFEKVKRPGCYFETQADVVRVYVFQLGVYINI